MAQEFRVCFNQRREDEAARAAAGAAAAACLPSTPARPAVWEADCAANSPSSSGSWMRFHERTMVGRRLQAVLLPVPASLDI